MRTPHAQPHHHAARGAPLPARPSGRARCVLLQTHTPTCKHCIPESIITHASLDPHHTRIPEIQHCAPATSLHCLPPLENGRAPTSVRPSSGKRLLEKPTWELPSASSCRAMAGVLPPEWASGRGGRAGRGGCVRAGAGQWDGRTCRTGSRQPTVACSCCPNSRSNRVSGKVRTAVQLLPPPLSTTRTLSVCFPCRQAAALKHGARVAAAAVGRQAEPAGRAGSRQGARSAR